MKLAVESPKEVNWEKKFAKLILWNQILAVLHLVQAMVIIAISSDATFQVTQAYQRFNAKTQSLEAAVRPLFNVQLAYGVAAFFLASSFAHFYVGVLRKSWYVENLKRGVNKARWFEYALSASIMMVAIAMLSGMEDLTSLIMVFALTATMNMTGLIMETHNARTEELNWLSFNIGTFAGLIPWVAIAIFFWAAETASQGAQGSIPTFVYFIFVSIFLFFNCFAINMILQYKKVGKWSDYLYGERVYMLLSLVAKTLLAWQIFAGTLQP